MRKNGSKVSRNSYIHKVGIIIEGGKKKLLPLIMLFLLSSLLDVVGIGLVAPYIALLVNSGSEIPVVAIDVLDFFYISSVGYTHADFTIAVGWALIIVFIAKAIVAIFVNYKILSFCFNQGLSLRSYLMKSYQNMKYEDYLKRNSSEYIRNINLAANFSHGILQSILRLVSEGIVVIAIFIFLAYKEPYVILTLLILLILLFLAYDYFFKRKVDLYGKISNNMLNLMLKGVYEGIEGMKEIKILGKSEYFYNIVNRASRTYAKVGLKSSIIAKSPRYLIELFLVTFIVMLVFISYYLELNNENLLPMLSMFGLASIRLTPSINQIVSSVSKIRFGKDTVRQLYNDVSIAKDSGRENSIVKYEIKAPNFESVVLKNVSFSYKGHQKKHLHGINLQINQGDSIGIIGGSGAGKSTLINIIAGLIDPTQGSISYNSIDIRNNIINYASMLAYIPQQVFLIDDTVISNIALGVERSNIDKQRIEDAVKKSKLEEFIQELPMGLDTIIGEKGTKISGGQRQRVALARAFYHDRDILIMDESTSSLDEEIEKQIIDEIKQLKGEKTLIIVAHRMGTIKHCDRIYRLDKGTIVDFGSFEEVVGGSSDRNI
jgi:ATP-binding cassette, subfamily B, bacterial PglK